SLAAENRFQVSWCRAGAWVAFTDDPAPGPWHPASSDLPGDEIKADRSARLTGSTTLPALVALDRTGQVGDPFDRLGDSSVLIQRELYLRRSAARTAGVKTISFLTAASPRTAGLFWEVRRLVRFLARECTGPGRKARWATARAVRTELAAWEAATGQPPAAGHGPAGPALEPVALRVRAAHLAGITRLRNERMRGPTTPVNLEFRWWALGLWRAAIASLARGHGGRGPERRQALRTATASAARRTHRSCR
ncbi:MAG: hypothetical protein HY815_11645, partial [Candidatus Riflebacteria bacterium]|nr:hypothetical protein [Candidatus Riflebacteria bacterium]